MSNYALVDENNIVENIIVWDGNTEAWQPPNGMTAILVKEGVFVDLGYTYKDGIFSATE